MLLIVYMESSVTRVYLLSLLGFVSLLFFMNGIAERVPVQLDEILVPLG